MIIVSTADSMILVAMGKTKTMFLFFMTISPGSLPRGNLGKSNSRAPPSASRTPKIIKKRAILCMSFSRTSEYQVIRLSESILPDALVS
jgi:hypothetical protein